MQDDECLLVGEARQKDKRFWVDWEFFPLRQRRSSHFGLFLCEKTQGWRKIVEYTSMKWQQYGRN